MPLLQQNGLVLVVERRLVTSKLGVELRPDLVRPLRQTLKDAIESAMILCGGNLSLAARRLQLKRSTLQSMRKKFVRDGN